MRLFARRQDSRPSSTERPGRRARWRARPEAEALDSRVLMASGNLSDRVAQAVKPYLDQGRIPGISVAIVNGGQAALAQGFGLSDVAAGAPVAADTRFGIGSVTKTFTAVGVLLLYQESQGTSHPLDLNAPISEYLHNTPTFKLPRSWSRVTAMELLGMTSGIGNGSGALTWQAQVRSIANKPLLYAPGTKTNYSDTNFDLLGELIEQWSGETYGTFIQTQILDPLGMSGTQVLGRSAMVPNQAIGYDSPRRGGWPRAKLQNGSAMYAAAGMVSTAQDMATYMTALLSGRLLEPATYQLMWTSTSSGRGLGWDMAINTSAGTTMVAKGGSVPGYISELILYPNSDSGIFVTINTNPHGSRTPSRVGALQVAETVYAASQTGSVSGG